MITDDENTSQPSLDDLPRVAIGDVSIGGDVGTYQPITIAGSTVQGSIIGAHIYQYNVPRPVSKATLGAVEARLATMPAEDGVPIPRVASLPHFSHIKAFIRNHLFVGRESDMRALARALKERDCGRPVAITTGIGGVGKTQLAIEFAHRYGQ